MAPASRSDCVRKCIVSLAERRGVCRAKKERGARAHAVRHVATQGGGNEKEEMKRFGLAAVFYAPEVDVAELYRSAGGGTSARITGLCNGSDSRTLMKLRGAIGWRMPKSSRLPLRGPPGRPC